MSIPPKELMQDLTKGVGKVFIAPYGGGEWTELGEVVTKAIEIKESIQESEMSEKGKEVMINLTVGLAMGKMVEIMDRLIEAYSHRKRRKTTYKTLRHDCAKRNGRR